MSNSTHARPVLRPYQERAIAELHRRVAAGAKRVLLVAPTGAGKCVTPETLVWSRGLRRFGDLWGETQILGPAGSAEIAGWYDDGRRAGLEVTLANGLRIDGTPSHRVWVRDDAGNEGWKSLGELGPEHYVAIARGRADFGDVAVPPEEAYTLGVLIADGCAHDIALQIDKQRPLLERVRPVIEAWRAELSPVPADVRIQRVSERHDVLLVSGDFRGLLWNKYGLRWAHSENRSTPESVLRGTRDTVRAFLRGYFDGDGYCDKAPCVSTASERLAEEVLHLLLGLGVLASIRRKRTPRLPAFVVTVCDVRAFAREVGFTRYRLTKDRAFERVLQRARNTNVDVVPGLGALLRRANPQSTLDSRRTGAWRHAPAYYRGKNPSYDMLRRWLDEPGALPACPERAELERIARDHYAWARVRRVEPSVRRRIDCEVREQHAFIGGGIVNHNTVLASDIMLAHAQAGRRILFLAHRRELINQTYRKLRDVGLPDDGVGVIMATDARRRPTAPVQVASIDTLRYRARPPADVVFVDEFFPAGTLVDGRPIETIRVGDRVRSFNHRTAQVELRTVQHVFTSAPSTLVTVQLASGERITCTAGHPFFTSRGYIPAAQLTVGDTAWRISDGVQAQGLRGVRDDLRAAVMELENGSDLLCDVSRSAARGTSQSGHIALQRVRKAADPERTGAVAPTDRSRLLLSRLQQDSGRTELVRGDGRNESAVCRGTHEAEQSDVSPGSSGTGKAEAAGYELGPPGAERQRSWTNRVSAEAGGSARLADGGRRADSDSARHRVPDLLQARRRRRGTESRDRGRWPESLRARAQSSGREEGAVLIPTRVAGVEVHQRAGANGFGRLCPEDRVYNLEVEGNHNYFANGLLTHNCHRALAASYRTVAAEYPAALHIGLTATPYRADGRGLGDAYDELIVVASPRELIAEGFLVEPRVFTVPTEERADLSHVRVTRGEYSASDLDDAMNRQGLVGNIVTHWQTHAPQVRTVVFAVSIDHSRNIVRRFQEAGVPAEHLDGTTPTAERDAILRRLDSGETLVVGSVGTLSEGWDQPSVKCAVLARPTKSTGLYLQQVGRILRPWNGQRAIVLDHAGCVLEHGLPQADREFTLETKPKSRAGQAPVRACPACFRVVGISTPRCPQCGYELIAERDFPKELAGELVEVTAPIAPPKSRTPSTRDVSELLRAAARAGRSVPWSAVSALAGTSRK
jgi:superfamily II DNA or RNA helicase/intein/homing endonuclease